MYTGLETTESKFRPLLLVVALDGNLTDKLAVYFQYALRQKGVVSKNKTREVHANTIQKLGPINDQLLQIT